MHTYTQKRNQEKEHIMARLFLEQYIQMIKMSE